MVWWAQTLIHPSNASVVNEVWAPKAADVARAHDVIAAHDEAVRNGNGVGVANGKLVEELHAKAARRLLAVDAAIQARAHRT